MEFRQLTYFLAAAETQNFRKAADHCFIAQSALSRQIGALEEELGVELFRRHKQRVSLTAAGQTFTVYARSVLDLLQQSQQAMVRFQEGQRGTLVIGCVEPLAAAFVPAIFPSFHRQYPEIHVHVRVSRTDELLELIAQGEVDLGLLFDPQAQSERLIIQELLREPLQLLVAAHHPLAQQRAPLSLARIVQEPFFLLGESSRLRRSIDRILAQHGHQVQTVLLLDSIEGLKELIKQGTGVTFMLPALVRPDQLQQELRLLPIVDLHETFTFCLAYRRFGGISLAARQFINVLDQRSELTHEQKMTPD